MSDYGIIIKNANNRIQIDSAFKNHSYYTHGSGTIYANAQTELGGFTSIADPPLTCFKLTNDYIAIQGYRKNGADYDRIRFLTTASQTVNWLMYRKTQPQTPPANSYGMMVYDSNSELVFSSLDTGFVNIANIHVTGSPGIGNITPVPDTSDYTDVVVEDADNNYFQLNAADYGIQLHGDDKRYNSILGIKKISSTVVRIGWVLLSTTTWNSGGLTGTANASISSELIEIIPPPNII